MKEISFEETMLENRYIAVEIFISYPQYYVTEMG
jgi:hypothetical protein